MDMPCVRVRRTGERWGVTQQGIDWFLAEFALWQDAIDYARGLAVAAENSIVEGEDFQGRIALPFSLKFWTCGVFLVRRRPFFRS